MPPIVGLGISVGNRELGSETTLSEVSRLWSWKDGVATESRHATTIVDLTNSRGSSGQKSPAIDELDGNISDPHAAHPTWTFFQPTPSPRLSPSTPPSSPTSQNFNVVQQLPLYARSENSPFLQVSVHINIP